MRILVCSDLHLEFYNNQRWLERNYPKEDTFDAVIMAGDIDTWTNGIAKAQLMFKDKPVFITFGNHEYYGHTYQDLRYMFIGKNYGNVHLLLGGDHYDLDFEDKTYRFIGATLWTEGHLEGYHTPDNYIEAAIADFKLIQYTANSKMKLNMELMRQICRQEKLNIKDALHNSHADHNIVFTHFMPTVEACKRGSYNGDRLNPYFATDCDDIIKAYGEEFIDLWVFGHTHDRMDFKHPATDTRLIAHPMGYPGEIAEPYEWKIVEV